MAAENRLWGAPRIYGELRKLGFAVSERRVSRDLRGRLTAPSRTWRTFLANHLGDLVFTSMVRSSYAPSDDDGVHARGLPLRLAWSLRAGPCASNEWAVVDWHLRTSTRAGVEDAVGFHDFISRCAMSAMK